MGGISFRCPECGKVLSELTNSHTTKKHNKTLQEFLKDHPQLKMYKFNFNRTQSENWIYKG